MAKDSGISLEIEALLNGIDGVDRAMLEKAAQQLENLINPTGVVNTEPLLSLSYSTALSSYSMSMNNCRDELHDAEILLLVFEFNTRFVNLDFRPSTSHPGSIKVTLVLLSNSAKMSSSPEGFGNVTDMSSVSSETEFDKDIVEKHSLYTDFPPECKEWVVHYLRVISRIFGSQYGFLSYDIEGRQPSSHKLNVSGFFNITWNKLAIISIQTNSGFLVKLTPPSRDKDQATLMVASRVPDSIGIDMALHRKRKRDPLDDVVDVEDSDDADDAQPRKRQTLST